MNSQVSHLISAVITNKDNLSYINLDEKNRYLGWTHDFNLDLPDGKRMKLNLKNERDLFLLFILASSWSKTGQWENAAYFVTYLKMSGKDIKEFWLDDNNIRSEVENRNISASNTVESCKWLGASPRRKVSFRIDYYSSIKVLSKNWDNIIESLHKSETKSDYPIFIDYIRKLDGLGTGKNRMKIKILLILRELRCQNVYKNIPGEYCCVSDERVRNASKKIGINLPAISQFTSILKASEIIYKNFGDLYDIPLFAYDDLQLNPLKDSENTIHITSDNLDISMDDYKSSIHLKMEEIWETLKADEVLANDIDFAYDFIPPFSNANKTSDIKLVIIGQDPTVRNIQSRDKIKYTLNLDKQNSIRKYLDEVCSKLHIDIESEVYATNLYKCFFNFPPADDETILTRQFKNWMDLLIDELQVFKDAVFITLGEPLIRQLIHCDNRKVSYYWNYVGNTKSGYNFKYSDSKENYLQQKIFPLPHQPTWSRNRFYRTYLKDYLEFILGNKN